MKSLLLTAVTTLGLTAATMAQNVPSYVPTNELTSWWPFNGTAADESGNGNNGTLLNPTLSSDRFSNPNSAVYFNQISDIICTSISVDNPQDFSISLWFKTNSGGGWIFGLDNGQCDHIFNWDRYLSINSNGNLDFRIFTTGSQNVNITSNITYNDNQWHHCVYGLSNSTMQLYVDGSLVANSDIGVVASNYQGYWRVGGLGGVTVPSFIGQIDDIGLWNRALNEQEIIDLYNAVNCSNNTLITPEINDLNLGSTATFSVNTSYPNPTYVWQSNFGQGYQTLNDLENYSGTNTSSLNIANVQLSEHNQPIRVITTSGECVDTSNIATISILDTCLTSINDTTFITVTDTLLINTLITGINPPNNLNTIKVYPNPANSHITIDYGNFATLNGYQLKIENSLGQQLFQTNINQQTDYLSLNNWGGNGLYFVHIIDAQGNTIDIRKIVLQ